MVNSKLLFSKEFIGVLFMTLIIIFSCKKEDNKISNFNTLIKIDSFYAFGVNPDDARCPLTENSFAGVGIIRFEYDQRNRISKMTKRIDGRPDPFCTYIFSYNDSDQPISVISSSADLSTMVHDSIVFTYPALGVIEAINYVKINTGGLVYPIYTVSLTESPNEIILIATSKDFSNPATTRFKAVMKRNGEGDITSAVYYNKGTVDTFSVLQNEYYTTLNNPFYSIYERVKFPWFYLIRFGGLSSGWHIMDLTQVFSKHSIRQSKHRYFNGCLGGGTPTEIVRDYFFPLDSTYRPIGNKVTQMVHQNRFMTLTGFINHINFITYK
jgi:hypothetical protein